MAKNSLTININISQYDELVDKLKTLVALTQEIIDNLDVIRVRNNFNSGEE